MKKNNERWDWMFFFESSGLVEDQLCDFLNKNDIKDFKIISLNKGELTIIYKQTLDKR